MTPQADQVAAARREANRRHATLESGEESAIRTYTVEVTTEGEYSRPVR